MKTRLLTRLLSPTVAALTLCLAPPALAQPDVAIEDDYEGPVLMEMNAGQTVNGEISADDYAPGPDYHCDIYLIELEAGVNYRFRVTGQGFSPDYVPDLGVYTGDGNPVEDCLYEVGEGLFVIQVPQAGTYSVVVGALMNEVGSYVLVSDTVDEAPTQRPGPMDEGPAQVTPVVPDDAQQFSGAIDNENLKNERGVHFSFLTMELNQGETYHFLAESAELELMLNMQDNDGNVVTISGFGLDGRYIVMTPPASGNYTLLIIAREPNQMGPYTVTYWQGDAPAPGPQPGPRRNQPIAAHNETLDQNDIALDDGRFFAFHVVELEAGVTYQIDLASDGFDTVAYLFDADNNQLDTNDNGPDMGTHSRIVFTPPTAGSYSVGVSSAAAEQSGNYLLLVTPQGAAPGPGPGPEPAVESPAVLIEVQASATGDQSYYSNDMRLQAGQRIAIETYGLSEGCDTIVQLRRSTDPDQARADDPVIGENDDDAGLRSSRLVVEIPETGDYYVLAGVYEDNGGDFTLIVREAWPYQEPLTTQVELQPGQSQLLGDFQFGTQQNYIVIETLDMTEGFDSVLELRKTVDPERAAEDDPLIVSNDDFFSNALESRIYFKPEEPGLYYVRLRNIGEQAGSCTFRIRFED
jgi:hypothetical protein